MSDRYPTDVTPGLAAALAELQAQLPHIGKDSAAVVPTKAGGAFGYKYADLATVSAALLPVMGKLGLAFTAKPTIMPDGTFVLSYSLLHSSGQSATGLYPLPDPARATPQQIGSAITYARRYCLCAVTGAAPDEDDDDGAAAEQGPAAARLRPVPTAHTDPEHARLVHGTADERVNTRPARRSSAPDEDDQWRDQPANPLPGVEGNRLSDVPAEDRPGTIDGRQRTALHVAFGKLGITDRAERLEACTGVIGRKVESSTDLSYREASLVLAWCGEQAKAAGK